MFNFSGQVGTISTQREGGRQLDSSFDSDMNDVTLDKVYFKEVE